MEEQLIKNYEIKLNYPGCHIGSVLLIANIMLDNDLTELLPYLNACAESAKYIPKFNWIKFKFHGYPEDHNGTWDVAIREKKVLVRVFTDKDMAGEICEEVIHYLTTSQDKRKT